MLKIIQCEVGKFMVNVIRQKFNLMFKFKKKIRRKAKKLHEV